MNPLIAFFVGWVLGLCLGLSLMALIRRALLPRCVIDSLEPAKPAREQA